jgi:hypothetical protein
MQRTKRVNSVVRCLTEWSNKESANLKFHISNLSVERLTR